MNLQYIFDKYKDRDLFLSDKSCLTYKECYIIIEKILSYLISKGLKKNHKILISSENSIELALFYLAFLYNGNEVYILSSNLTSQTYNTIFSKTDFFLAIVDDRKKFKKIKSEFVYNLEKDKLMKHIMKNSRLYKIKPNKNFNKKVLNIYTSGTTSEPKKVSHSLNNLYGNAVAYSTKVKISKNHRFINFLPMSYLGGYYNLILIPFFNGSSIYIDKIFSFKTLGTIFNHLQKYNINTLWITPTICKMLVNNNISIKNINIIKDKIKFAFIGMDTVDKSLKERFVDLYGIRILENYGLSETLFISTETNSTNSFDAGRPLNKVQIIIDKNSNELQVSSPFIAKNYKNKMFKTGDKAKFKRSIKIIGRIKDIIIRGGLNINPLDIENVLINYNGIREISVFGIKDKTLNTDRICVAIVKENSFNLSKFWSYAKKNLTTSLLPQDIIFIENLPKTFSGKVQKNLLRKWPIDEKDNEVISNTSPKKIKYFSKNVESIHAPISVAINDKVYDLKKNNIKITTLSLGEAFFDIPLFNFNKLKFPEVYHYSHSRGIYDLRLLLSNYFKKAYEVSFNPNNEIMVTAGSKIAIYIALKTIVDDFDEVIIPEPAWVSYSEQVKLVNAKPVGIPMNTPVKKWQKYINKKTKLIIINNPNNPTGKVYSISEMSYIYQLAKKNNIYILSDEAYSEFCNDREKFVSIGNLDQKFERSILINSISKNYGISGWRIGYSISNRDIIDRMVKINQHLITCAPTILTHYISKHFYEIIKYTYPQIQNLLKLRINLSKYMKKNGILFIEGEATFYFFLNIGQSKLSSEKFCQLLLSKYKISAVPGIGYGKSCNKYIRISIGSENEQSIKKALIKIKKIIET